MKRSVRIITGILGILMFLPGLNKFFESAHTKFFDQVILSDLPFTTFTYWLAIVSELVIGLTLVFLALFEKNKHCSWAENFLSRSFCSSFYDACCRICSPSSECTRGNAANSKTSIYAIGLYVYSRFKPLFE